MSEFYEFSAHPLGIELRKRVHKIICRMAFFRYRTHALYSAQLSILHDLLALEDSLRACRDKSSSLRTQASQIALAARQKRGSLTDFEKKQVKSLQQEANDYAFAVRLLRYGRWLYRYVADGIAWRAYGFNREVIRALGAKGPVPFLSNKEGIEKETNLFRAIRRQGNEWLPLMHDLTNCLRTGDFSVFKSGTLIRIFELKIRQSDQSSLEQKSSPRNPREARQAKRLEEVSEFLQTGDLTVLNPDIKRGKSIKCDVSEKHNFIALSRAIASARKKGFGYQEPESGILYIAWDGQTNPTNETLYEAKQSHPHIFDTLCTFRSISPRFQEYHISLPITTMELPSRDISDIIFGRIALMCIVNYACVEMYCRENGVPISFHHDQYGHSRIIVDSEPYGGEVHEGLWNRLLLEALSLQSFKDLIIAIMDEY